jgi:Fe-S cluster assembly protein SufD
MTKIATEAEIALSSFFEARRNDGAADLRKRAWDRFSRLGLPNRRVEAWHYTDLRAALGKIAPIGAVSSDSPKLDRTFDSLRLVTLDGGFRPDLSDLSDLPEGVAVQSLREALTQGDAATLAALGPENLGADDAAVSLNAALMSDGVVLRIAPGAQVARTLEIAAWVSGETARSVFTRSLVIMGEGAQATILETPRALALMPAQENHALVFALGAGARIEHIAHVAAQAEEAVRVLSLLARLDRESALNSFCLIEGGGLSRRQIFARLSGDSASVAFNGATMLRGRCHADTTLVVEHAGPKGKSRERFRTIIDDHATGVFQGKVAVLPAAQKTDGAMQSKALLLSDTAAMNNKPELEILADDVLCGHGATCGRLDADQLFYLTARGLPRHEAEALLIEGFANEALELIEDDRLREALAARVCRWLARSRNSR